ncbi:MAG: PH domain-containing protein [Mycobacteriales bacterium]
MTRRAIPYWAARAGLGWLVPVGGQVISLIVSQAAAATRITVVAATVLLAIAHCVVMPRWRFHVHRWEATDEAVYTQSGWFTQERRIAPVSRIQTVDTERGPLEQLFGLADVTITTASAAGPLSIKGLSRRTAEQLVDALTATTQAIRGDAT